MARKEIRRPPKKAFTPTKEVVAAKPVLIDDGIGSYISQTSHERQKHPPTAGPVPTRSVPSPRSSLRPLPIEVE